MPAEDDALRLIRQGLSIGQTFTSGTDQIKVVRAFRGLNNLYNVGTKRFVSPSLVLDTETQRQLTQDAARMRDAILKDLATDVMNLLEKNIQSLTEHQYQTLVQLADMGHPYAKRHVRDARGRYNPRKRNPNVGNGTVPPAYVVNSQTNALAQNFQYNVLGSSGNYKIVSSNSQGYSGLLVTGTNTAIARPYDKQAVDLTRRETTDTILKHAEMLQAIGQDPSLAKTPEIDFILGNVKRDYPGK